MSDPIPLFLRREYLRLGPYRAQVHLEGDTGIHLNNDDYERRLGPLRDPDQQPGHVDMTVTLRSSTDLWPRPGQPKFYQLTAHKQQDELHVSRLDLDARLSMDTFTIEGECESRLQPLEECLRLLLWLRLSSPAGNGLLVHSASTVSKGQAWCFPAYGGTGKSTLARETPGDEPLCDELSLLVRDEEGVWQAWHSPFWNWYQNLRADAKTGCSWPLAGLGFLNQAPSTSLSPIGEGEALTRLMQQAIAFESFPTHASRTFELAADLVEDMRKHHQLGILNLRKGEDPYPAMCGKKA